MKIRPCIWLLGILVFNTACYQAVERPGQEIIDNSTGGASSSYPPPLISNSSSSSSTDDSTEQNWTCGTEWILLKDPDGNDFYVEIPRSCDPLADIYTGCPAPNNI